MTDIERILNYINDMVEQDTMQLNEGIDDLLRVSLYLDRLASTLKLRDHVVRFTAKRSEDSTESE